MKNPRNTPAQRAAIRNIMARIAARQESDCRHARDYPKFVPGMSTTRYLCLFATTHAKTMLPIVNTLRLNRPAPMYDPSFPECVEHFEIDEPATA